MDEFQTTIEPNKITMILPLRTVSEFNCFQPWRTKHKRHQDQKKMVFWAMFPQRELLKLPCTVTMIRQAKRELDEKDNLRGSMKYIADGIAEQLTQDFVPGRADSDKRISWQYGQEFSKKYAVKLVFEF